jgi:hypothetical protein
MSDQPQQQAVNVSALLDKYIELRDGVERINKKAKDEAAPLVKAMETIETYFMKLANETGQTQFGNDSVVAFTTTKTGCNIADKERYKAWLLEDPARWRTLTLTANKTAIAEHIGAAGTPPPGINWTVMKDIQIRRK